MKLSKITEARYAGGIIDIKYSIADPKTERYVYFEPQYGVQTSLKPKPSGMFKTKEQAEKSLQQIIEDVEDPEGSSQRTQRHFASKSKSKKFDLQSVYDLRIVEIITRFI